MPTLKDLNGRIPDGIYPECLTLRNYCYWLRELCRGESEYLKIESVATNILSAQIFSSEQERLQNAMLRFELLRFITRSMHRSVPLSESASRNLSNFLNAVANDRANSKRDNLILSFNYDTLIEDQVQQDSELFASTAVDYGVNIEYADRSAGCGPRPRTIDLLKLHGSLNWYPVKGAVEEFDLKNVCRVEPGDRSFPMYEKDNPIFIPMAHAKDSFLRGSLFNVIWAKADYYLSNADEIFVIGYGFPQTDGNSFPFLLKHRDRIRNVVVFEPKWDASLERLERLFGKGVVVCEDAQNFLNGLILDQKRKGL
ncbi:MAG: hypothetical protein J6Z31_05310 [Fibrobacter sp.]|nr:hypothetical protein [Fibrobacter sp.]